MLYHIINFKLLLDNIAQFHSEDHSCNPNSATKSNGKTKRGPNTRNPNSDGYYTAQIKKQTKVWSCDEIQSGVYRGDT
uniref:Uncharacterized protein n=1 Tax=viral metagenome TaxID=1070528 RepID=A0A6C0KZE6_9ZZZZ